MTAFSVGELPDISVDLFDYPLPESSIAQTPLMPRDASRLLHATPAGIADLMFTDLPGQLRRGDLLVANETRVRAARLHGSRENGGHAELLVLAPLRDGFACLVRPARRLPEGMRVRIGEDLVATIHEAADGHPGARRVTFDGADVDAAIEAHGEMPLPPYIHERLADRERYQTTYAAGPPASAAAPTAGLHFTPRVRAALEAAGVGWETLRLEVGLGTFAPMRAETIGGHAMHEETFSLSAATAERINLTRAGGGRIVAVGTTSVRVLETCGTPGGVVPGSGSTRLYITPGFAFNAVDGLLTNFHHPRSSLLVLIAAFMGLDRWRPVYEHAVREGYRFLSFGDCMLTWRTS